MNASEIATDYRTEENFGDQKVLQIYNYGFLAKNSLANQ